MLQSSVTQKVLYVFHIIISLSALGLVCFSVYYYSQLEEFVSLRDPGKRAGDDMVPSIYVLPWVYFTIGLFAVTTSAIGLLSTKLYNQSAALCMTISSALFIAVALTMALTTNLRTSGDIDTYITYVAMEIMGNRQMGIYEQRFTCCGATGKRDYPYNDVSKFCCDPAISTCTSDKAYPGGVGCITLISQYVHVVNWGLFCWAMVICAWESGTVVVALKTYLKKKRQQKELTSSTLYGIAEGQGKTPDQSTC